MDQWAARVPQLEEAFFDDSTMSAVEQLPPKPTAAERIAFKTEYLTKLATQDAEEVLNVLQNFDSLLAKASAFDQSTRPRTLLSLSRSAGDPRCIEAIAARWFLQPHDLEERMPLIKSTYRFGVKHKDCARRTRNNRGMDMSYTLFHKDTQESEIMKILHRFCVPQNHFTDPLEMTGTDNDTKKRGHFTVCCSVHMFRSEVTLVYLHFGGLLVLVRKGDVHAD